MNELKRLNAKEELPIELQRRSAKAAIIGPYTSIFLTIAIFVYTCNTTTEVKGWKDLIGKQNDLISKQSLSIGKQNTLISYQDSFNHKQDSIIGTLGKLVVKQDDEIALMKGQVESLQFLVEKNQRLDSLSNQQNLQMQGVLKNVEDMLRVQVQNQDAEIFKTYHELYSIIKSLPRFEYDDWVGDTKIFSDSWKLTTKEFCKKVIQRMDVGMANPYLKYDSTAGAKWFNMYFLISDLISTIEAQLPYMPPPNWEQNRMMKMHSLYESFIDEYPKFLNYFDSGIKKTK